ncbi:MAG: sigma-54-dependent Fis family transcriptional regulator [Nitrospirae bacterium]|nr:sigma-54-dependent Fis family transcriptional regulator [Candidatus Manganitrophaceae bacterium]
MSRHQVLIIDDEKVQAAILQEILTSEGIGVTALSDSAKALELVKEVDFDLVVTDLRMPRIGGLELLRSMKTLKPSLTVIVMTAYGTIETAVQAMREGAYDYVTKPFSKDEFVMTVKRAFKSIEMENENRYLKGELGLKYQAGNILGKSQAMQNVLRMVRRVSSDDKATILITGETGTGKSVVARTIHYNSARKEEPFVEVNCAAIPEGLLESEFFGHEKGAFTGATAHRVGRFELADRGTLFLDEVAEMNGQLQGKFLHVVETRAFERVGGTKTVKVDVRIIAATNRDLQEEVRTGRFRGDLFYRLNVIPIHLPPLRERLEDIPILVEHFLEKFRQEGRRHVQISPEATQKLMEYDYPGNVRELENLLERAVILCDGGIISPDELYLMPKEKSVSAEPSPRTFKMVGRQAIENAEKGVILEALRRHHWNKSRVAEELQIDYKTLRLKIKRYEIDREY